MLREGCVGELLRVCEKLEEIEREDTDHAG